jgi:glycosyltransferase involved in cell wall biosynthesis
VLTERGKESLPPTAATRGRPVEVIPCCVDPQRFAAARDDRDAVRATLGLQGRLVLVHAGRLGGPYLVAELAELLATARGVEPRVFALLLTQGDARPIAAALGRAGFAPQDYRVLAVPPEEVPRHLLAADVGLCVLRPSPACRFSSPTKVAEYLAAGLPLIATAGVGDLDAQLEVGGLGALLPQLDEPAYLAAFRTVERLRADPGLGDRCRAAARRHYDLHTVGGERYRRLYAAVLRLEAGR